MTGPGGSNVSQACAACKHQRRKCAQDCLLAPYFPPHRQTEFLNAHKLFGVRNIVNTVKRVEPSRRDDAVRSMIHEAYYRAVDPAGGAYRILNNLEQTYTQMKAELNLVHQQLAMFRSIQVEGESDQMQHTPTFYSDFKAQDYGDVFQQQSTRSGKRTSNIVITHEKEESSSNRNKKTLQYSVPRESTNGNAKIDNVDENNPSSRCEREDSSPEDVKPNVHVDGLKIKVDKATTLGTEFMDKINTLDVKLQSNDDELRTKNKIILDLESHLEAGKPRAKGPETEKEISIFVEVI
ncbi:LOB domain-containing protein [Heracleum sosnowskyi]|uniref:LOB domain-containing protein n=1 Tax=Heracleum sosnowskyi TaxID=360622 RepID=A0AAD8HJV7_9APIA|nr:LOB domain-containing protein [Heracleum sosnowskyi]